MTGILTSKNLSRQACRRRCGSLLTSACTWRVLCDMSTPNGSGTPLKTPDGDSSDPAVCLRARSKVAVFAAILLMAPGCKRVDEAPARSQPDPAVASRGASSLPARRFTDVAVSVGITHRHQKPVLDHKLDNVMSWVCSVGAAAAAGDYNNDGWIDLYVTNSRKGTPNFLYRNNGDGTFTDVGVRAGVADLNGDSGTSMDCAWGDVDNDGWIDLYVVRWGPDVLLRNNGDGTFTDATQRFFRKRDGSPGIDWANGNAIIFFDYNLDGRLDIYVGNYFDEVDLWNLKTTRIMHDDFEKSRNGGRNFLYRQKPDGTFIETAETLSLDDPGWTLAVGSADVDNDGWPDLYCADDFGPDQLFINNRNGTFSNVSESAIGSDTKKGMNVDFGDFNNDGWLDICVTNITTAEYLQEGNMLWHNNGRVIEDRLTFTDVAVETGVSDGGWGWGAKFFDYDRDGDLDIIALNGFISAGEGNYWYDLASWTVTRSDPTDSRNWPTIGDRSFSGYEATRLFRNDGLFSFTQRAKELGIESTRDGRGAVCFDYDNDGDVDLFIANQNDRPHLYRNNGGDENHWLIVALEADPSTGVNRDAIGARVTVVTPEGMYVRERDGGNGFSGQSDPRLHFGLGEVERISLLEVRWPDGGLQYVEDVPADQIMRIRQDPSRYADQLAIVVAPPTPHSAARETKSRAEPTPSSEQIDQLLSEMEDRLRTRPPSYALASLYRSRCAAYDRHDRAIEFFAQLAADFPDSLDTRIELGCAYVDKIPTCGGLAAVVCKGSMARTSLDHLNQVAARRGDYWLAHYCLGMNHLHWPRALLHTDDAAASFEKCAELQEREASDEPRGYYMRTYLLLGDAHAKGRRHDQARQAWRRGLALFPDSPDIRERLAIVDDRELSTFVDTKRNLQAPIDTDLSFLDRRH